MAAVALVVAICAGIAACAAPEWVLVLGTATAARPVLFVALFTAGIAMTAGHLLARQPGPLQNSERAVLRGVVASVVVLSLVGVPMLGFIVLMVLSGFWVAVAAPIPLALAAFAVVVGAAGLRHGQPPAAGRPPDVSTDRSRQRTITQRSIRWVASALLTVGVMVLTAWVLGLGVLAADDDVVVAHDPDGCTAVVRQVQVLLSGEAVLYVSSPGSVVATRRAAYPLEETFPFRTEDFVLEAGAEEVRVAFDSGLGPVDEVVSCR